MGFPEIPMVSYQPYNIIFTGDTFDYGVTWRPLGDASPYYGRSSVILMLNTPPVAANFTVKTFQNTMTVRKHALFICGRTS